MRPVSARNGRKGGVVRICLVSSGWWDLVCIQDPKTLRLSWNAFRKRGTDGRVDSLGSPSTSLRGPGSGSRLAPGRRERLTGHVFF